MSLGIQIKIEKIKETDEYALYQYTAFFFEGSYQKESSGDFCIFKNKETRKLFEKNKKIDVMFSRAYSKIKRLWEESGVMPEEAWWAA